MTTTIDELFASTPATRSGKGALRRFKRLHSRNPTAAERLVEIAHNNVSAATFSDDEDIRDDQEDSLCERILVSARQENEAAFGIVSSVIMGVIVKLIVDFLMSKLGS